MNILLINHYAGSTEMGMEFRPYYFAREWIKLGHRVDIVAADFSHLRIQNPTVDQDFQTEEIDGIVYHWIKAGRYEGNGVKRAITMFRFVGKLWIHAKRIVREWKPDVVITSSTYPLDTYAGQRIAKLSGAKLIHEVHDMWPISLTELGGMSEKHPFVKLMAAGEKSFAKNADLIVSLLPNAKEHFINLGMPEGHFQHVSNGIIVEEWDNPTPLPREHLTFLKGLKDKFIIGFLGSHTKAYALDYLIEALEMIPNPDICALFVGKGNQKEELQKLVQDKHLETRVYFLPPIPKGCVPSLLNYMDVIYVGAIHNDMFRFGICMNKLFDSMASGKPILYAVDAPNNYIEAYKCGICVAPEDAVALKGAMETLYHMPLEERKLLGQNGKTAVMQYFTYDKLAKKFEALF